jgi:uncharacterized membrane protein YfcA
MIDQGIVVLLLSVLAGGFGAIVGIGGGVVIVPVLTVLVGVPVKFAIAASLVGVIATSTAASARYLETEVADRRLGLVLLLGTVSGGIAGGFVAGLLDARTLSGLFAVMLVLVAVQMLRGREPDAPAPGRDDADGVQELDHAFASSYREPTTGALVPYRARRVELGTAISLFAGSVSGLLGVGGGIINVPTMNVVMGIPLRVATTTSTYMLAATAVASALLYQARGELDPLVAAPVALGMFLGARGGARLAARLKVVLLRYLFVVVCVFFAWQMVQKVLGA